jgi:hypothetical protein
MNIVGFFCGQRLIKRQTTKVFETFVVLMHYLELVALARLKRNPTIKKQKGFGKNVTAGFPACQMIF